MAINPEWADRIIATIQQPLADRLERVREIVQRSLDYVETAPNCKINRDNIIVFARKLLEVVEGDDGPLDP